MPNKDNPGDSEQDRGGRSRHQEPSAPLGAGKVQGRPRALASEAWEWKEAGDISHLPRPHSVLSDGVMVMPRKWPIKGSIFRPLSGKSDETRKETIILFIYVFLNVNFRYLNSRKNNTIFPRS